MEVSFFATLRAIVGAKTVEIALAPGVPGAETLFVSDLMRAMVERWPALDEFVYDEERGLSRQVAIHLDGRNVRWLKGEETPIEPGQRIAIFPPVAGG